MKGLTMCNSWKICVVVLLLSVTTLASAKKKAKYEGDFEFVDEVSEQKHCKFLSVQLNSGGGTRGGGLKRGSIVFSPLHPLALNGASIHQR